MPVGGGAQIVESFYSFSIVSRYKVKVFTSKSISVKFGQPLKWYISIAPVINQLEIDQWGLKQRHVICNLQFNVPQLMISIEEGGEEAMKCPKCGSEDVKVFTISNTLYCKCGKCGYAWKTDL